MENTAPSYINRLRAHADRLLNALEAQAAPETYVDILRAARALIAVKKALDLVYDVAPPARPKRLAKPAPETRPERPAASETPIILNRHERRKAEVIERVLERTLARQAASG